MSSITLGFIDADWLQNVPYVFCGEEERIFVVHVEKKDLIRMHIDWYRF